MVSLSKSELEKLLKDEYDASDLENLLDAEYNASSNKIIEKWDFWTIFSEELPIVIHVYVKDHNGEEREIRIECWTNRCGKFLEHQERISREQIPLGFYYPRENYLGLHRWLSVREHLDDESNKHSVLALSTLPKAKKNRSVHHIFVDYVKNDHKSGYQYIDCFHLWGIPFIPKKIFISWCHDINLNEARYESCRKDIINKIRELLLIDPPQWGYNYEYLRDRSKFKYGELIKVENPQQSGRVTPGVVIGDTAVTGISRPEYARLLFLRLCEYKPSPKKEIQNPEIRPEEENFYYIPLPDEGKYYFNDKRQSIALTEFRIAPVSSVKRWSDLSDQSVKVHDMDNGKRIIARLKGRLGSYFKKELSHEML